jgi:hypothetical protein
MITQERLKELLHYCPETGIFTRIKSVSSNARNGDIAGYICRFTNYWYIVVDRRIYRAHILAWLYCYGKYPQYEIDHINREKSDNSIVNLRDICHSENNQNVTKPRSHNKTGYLGVYYESCTKKYRAAIQVNGKSIKLGRFLTPELAYKAYLDAKKIYHPHVT